MLVFIKRNLTNISVLNILGVYSNIYLKHRVLAGKINYGTNAKASKTSKFSKLFITITTKLCMLKK